MERLSCPVLALYGECDEWVPVEECVRRWNALPAAASLVEVDVLADAPHDLAAPGDTDRPDARYERALIDWLTRRTPIRYD
jgi:dienelactone hydrolase